MITEADFKNFRAIYEKKYEEVKGALQKQEEMLKRLFRNGVVSGVKLERFKEAMKLTELDRDTLLCFISREWISLGTVQRLERLSLRVMSSNKRRLGSNFLLRCGCQICKDRFFQVEFSTVTGNARGEKRHLTPASYRKKHEIFTQEAIMDFDALIQDIQKNNWKVHGLELKSFADIFGSFVGALVLVHI